MFKKIKSIYDCIPSQYKKSVLRQFVYSFFNMLLELLSIAYLIPIVMLIVKPKVSFESELLNYFFDPEHILVISIILILFFILKNYLGIRIIRSQTNLAYNISAELSIKNITSFLERDYSEVQKSSKGDTIRNTINIPLDFVNNILLALMSFLSELSIILIVLLLSVILFTKFSLAVFAIVAFLFLLLRFRKKKIDRSGYNLKLDYKNNMNNLLDLINGYLVIKSTAKEEYFVEKFDQSNSRLNENLAYLTALRMTNSKYIEIILIVFITALSFYLLNFSEEKVLMISFFATISLKLIPSLNKVSISLTNIRAYNYTIDIISKNKTVEHNHRDQSLLVGFKRELKVEELCFQYNKQVALLDNVNFNLKKGEMIGIYGRTGSGKTTLINIILKLIEPMSGKLSIDDNYSISKKDWLTLFSYVSQHPHILNTSIMGNITMEEGGGTKDLKELNTLLKAFDFEQEFEVFSKDISENLEQKLSGGQKQKVAIIRALYQKTEILILDEATNQLDEESENQIFIALKEIVSNKGLSIIFISHNQKILEQCDTRYELKDNTLSKISREV